MQLPKTKLVNYFIYQPFYGSFLVRVLKLVPLTIIYLYNTLPENNQPIQHRRNRPVCITPNIKSLDFSHLVRKHLLPNCPTSTAKLVGKVWLVGQLGSRSFTAGYQTYIIMSYNAIHQSRRQRTATPFCHDRQNGVVEL